MKYFEINIMKYVIIFTLFIPIYGNVLKRSLLNTNYEMDLRYIFIYHLERVYGMIFQVFWK